MSQEDLRQRKSAGEDIGVEEATVDNSRFDSSVPGVNMTDTRQYNSVQEYARTLQQWMWNYQCMASANSFYSMIPFYMSRPCHYFPQPTYSPGHQGPATFTPQGVPVAGPQAQTRTRPPAQTSTNNQGTEYILPSVWKRFLAEVIDFFILFYIKLIVSIGVMRQMGILESDQLELEGFYRTIILTPEDVDMDKLFALTSEIITLEIINRICITIVETMCLRRGIGVIGGATPGKRILGLCVVRCQEIVDLGNGRVRVEPAENIGLKRALVRSVIKNFTLAFFFPACLTIFFFHHNRAAYDVIAGTIVVQNIDYQERQ